MEGQGDGGGKIQHSGHSGFGALPALTGLPTSISCQRYSKMVALASSSLYRKKGQSAEDGAQEEEEGRGDAEEGEERGRAESTATPPPPSVFQSPVCQLSFSNVMLVEVCTENGERENLRVRGKISKTWFIWQNAHAPTTKECERKPRT